MGQITRAYTSTGQLRFDALSELKKKHPVALSELHWSNVYDRPDLQIRGVVLKMKDNIEHFLPSAATLDDALAFADAGYNGGNSGVLKEQRACKLSAGCNPGKWFGNVERYCLKSPKILYGNRSACDINRHHVKDVLLIRANKYKEYFK